ncbi:hypothetical protein Asi03nite_02830 [Actinoplanes siamensis]|uniref:Uncharacterized protein n=1 Tax=Actinoplanes siamensis TaxID=1223317 RepID=A0A919N0L9_9ACTN|nr:hypothetical protein Asi03nite_02830 [Actinoplanes siamensis]
MLSGRVRALPRHLRLHSGHPLRESPVQALLPDYATALTAHQCRPSRPPRHSPCRAVSQRSLPYRSGRRRPPQVFYAGREEAVAAYQAVAERIVELPVPEAIAYIDENLRGVERYLLRLYPGRPGRES